LVSPLYVAVACIPRQVGNINNLGGLDIPTSFLGSLSIAFMPTVQGALNAAPISLTNRFCVLVLGPLHNVLDPVAQGFLGGLPREVGRGESFETPVTSWQAQSVEVRFSAILFHLARVY